jgi:hypothetical protein
MSHALEAIGFLLAILDFSGWSRKLEEIVDRRRERYRDWLRSQNISLLSFKFSIWRESRFPRREELRECLTLR